VAYGAGRAFGEPRVRGLTIGEAAARLALEFPGLRAETLCAIERHGLLAPERTPAGYRRYTEADLDTVRQVLTGAPAPRTAPEQAPPRREPAAPRREPEPAATPVTLAPVGAPPPEPASAPPSDNPGVSRTTRPAAVALPPTAPAAEAAGGRRRSPRWPEPEYFTPELGEVALGRDGLARAAGLDEHWVAELAGFGLISGAEPATGADLLVARAAADLLGYGIEPRHLRPVAVAAGRAAAMVKAAAGGSSRPATAPAAAALVRLEAALLRAALLDD
jgi:hypothetical protein